MGQRIRQHRNREQDHAARADPAGNAARPQPRMTHCRGRQQPAKRGDAHQRDAENIGVALARAPFEPQPSRHRQRRGDVLGDRQLDLADIAEVQHVQHEQQAGGGHAGEREELADLGTHQHAERTVGQQQPHTDPEAPARGRRHFKALCARRAEERRHHRTANHQGHHPGHQLDSHGCRRRPPRSAPRSRPSPAVARSRQTRCAPTTAVSVRSAIRSFPKASPYTAH